MGIESETNKRIAKNTFILYFRMVFSMLVALYTSRVILNVLGVEDYGIYGVVGGIVILFNVISGSLNAAISRFITFEIGRGNTDRLNRIFCTSMNIQIVLSVVFVLLSETVGVWFLETQMDIPRARMSAAYWVFQCSIFTFVINLLNVPYNAALIANERMGAFAYISILSTLLNLTVALLINFVTSDKLIFYAIAVLGVNLLIRLIYTVYCRMHFQETRWYLIFDRPLLQEMAGFAGWNFFGASSGVLLGQGINVLMNLFFGVTVNAARSIAANVEGAVNQLINNFTMALNPQITKSYAAENLNYMHDLVCKGAKYSYFITYLIALPFLLETHQILVLWLKQVPDYAVVFTRWSIIITLSSVLSQTLITSMLATGDIKKYQIIISSLSFSIFILTYIGFTLGLSPYYSYIIQFIVFLIQLGVRLFLLKNMISLPIKKYTHEVLIRIIGVTLFSSVLPISLYYGLDEGFARFIFVSFISFISVAISVYIIGLTSSERSFLIEKVSLGIKKNISKFVHAKR